MRIIAGPNVYICNECIAICADLLDEEGAAEELAARFELDDSLPTPAQMKEQLDANGLKCVLTHVRDNRLVEDTAAVAAEHEIFGCQNVGLGQYKFRPEEGESVDKFVEIYGPVAKTLKACGKYFMYHNHDHEFRKENGRLVFDQLIERFSPEEMGFTLDTYWVQRGGGDPAQWLEKLAGGSPAST